MLGRAVPLRCLVYNLSARFTERSRDYSEMFTSAIQELLLKDSFTLEQLLDQEELIQEVRQNGEKLINL